MAEELLRLDQISQEFGGLRALDKVSFTVNEKEIFGVIGPNGAGKSTLFNLITGIYTPTSGDIYFKNQNRLDRPFTCIYLFSFFR